MRNRKIPNIRLNEPLKAVDVNRALDNIINTINPFVDEATIAINESGSPVQDVVGGNDISVTSDAEGVYTINYSGSPSGVNINGGIGINVVESPPGTFTVTNTLPEDTNVVAGTGIGVVESPSGTFTITNTSPASDVNITAGTGISITEPTPNNFVVTNTLPEDTDVVAGTGISVVESPTGTFTITNSDPDQTVALSAGTGISVTGTYPNFTITNTLPEDTNVVAGSGIAVTESPTGTFTIVNTNQGGGGGGGQILYLNGNIAGDAPLPVAGTKEFGQSVQPTGTNSGAITLPNTGAYVKINGFVTDLNVPDVLVIPAGIWDFNVFMATNAGQPEEVTARMRIYVWDGTTSTLIGTSNQVPVTNHTTVSQYTLSVIVAEQITTATDRIYALLDAHVNGSNSHTVTAYYGNTYPSHAHSTIPFAYVENILAGTDISVVESPTGTYTITNTAPDQVVSLTDGTGISITGTYPNFTITNSDPASSIDVTAGTGISVVESPTGTFAVTNTAPDQIVAMASGTGISVTGTYPNFTIANTDPASGINVTGGTGVAVTEPTPNNFSVAIGQPVATTDNVTFGVVTASTSVKTSVINPDSGITIQPTATAGARIVIVQGGTNTLGAGSQVNLVGGTSTAATPQAGGIARVDGGVASVGGTNGTVVVGNANASAVTIGRPSINTTIFGTLVANTQTPSTTATIQPATTSGTGFGVVVGGGVSSATIGGSATFRGGQGATAGGAVTIAGGTGGTTSGGKATLTGGANNTASGFGGDVVVTGGSDLATTSTGGNAYIEGGTGTSNNGSVNIGTDFVTLTSAINIGSVGTQNNGKTISLRGGTGTAGTGGNISVTAGTGTTTAGTISVTAGNSSTTTGGNVGITAGSATGASQTGGAVNIAGGVSNNGGVGGAASIGGGAGVTTGGATIITAGAAAAGGAISVTAGAGALSAGGSLTLKSGLSTASDGGELIIQANTGNSVGFRGGHVQIAAGNSTSGTGGNVYVEGGDAATDGTINIGTGTGTSPLGDTSAVTIGRTGFNTTINGGVTTPVVVGTYCYAEGSSANVSITNTSTPATLVYNGVSQNGISLNIATGNFTVPVSGIYRVNFGGIMRAVTVPATTWWIAYELFDATISAVQYTTTCFMPRASAGNSTAWATTDSYEFYMDQIINLTAGRTYRIRARNNTAAGTFVAGFEPTLTNANTSRNGRRFKLSIERKT